MKTTILPTFAAASVITAVLGVVFNFVALALFSLAVIALLLLVAATDYGPRPTYQRARCLAGVPSERLPLAG